jgi:hypothetical protein
MSAIFSGPPKLPKPPVMKPPQNTALDAEMQALARRQGSQAAMLTGPGGSRAGTPATSSHTLTGS